MIRLDGFGPLWSVLRMTLHRVQPPSGLAAADFDARELFEHDGTPGLTSGGALPHLPKASWPLPTSIRAFVCWPERRPTPRECKRLQQTPVTNAHVQRDASRLLWLLGALQSADAAGLRHARLESGRDERLGRLCPGFFPAREAAWDAGAQLVSFTEPDSGILVLAENESASGKIANAMRAIFDVHTQTCKWVFMAAENSDE
jgi:hypothetical protein